MLNLQKYKQLYKKHKSNNPKDHRTNIPLLSTLILTIIVMKNVYKAFELIKM